MKTSLPIVGLLLLCVNADAQSIVKIAQQTNHIAYDASVHRLFATSKNSNFLLVFNSTTGAMESELPTSSVPNQIAVSADGRYVYVGEDAAQSVQRFNASTGQSDIIIPLNCSAFGGPYHAESIACVPGSNSSVAVSIANNEVEGPQAVCIYDGVVQRTNIATNPNWPPRFDTLTFGNSSSQLFANGLRFMSLSVDASGVQLVSSEKSMFDGSLTYSSGTNCLYSSYGGILDVATKQLRGSLAMLPNRTGAVVHDSTSGRDYTLTSDGSNVIIGKYNDQTFLPIASVTIVDPGYPIDFTEMGPSTFAFNTSNAVYLTNNPPFVTLKSFNLAPQTIKGGKTSFGTVSFSSPTPAGGIDLNVGSNTLGGLQLYPRGNVVHVPAGVTSCQFKVQVPALDSTYDGDVQVQFGVQQLQVPIIDVGPAGGPVSPANAAVYPLYASDFVYDQASNRVYAIVGGFDPDEGNNLIAVNPNTGDVVDSHRIGSMPTTCVESGDSKSIFVALKGANAVSRFNLATHDISNTFWTERCIQDEPVYINTILPISRTSSSVVAQMFYYFIEGPFAELTAYDNGVPRLDRIASLGLPEAFYLAENTAGNELYSFSDSSASEYARFSLTSSGIDQQADNELDLPTIGGNLAYAGGRLFAGDGQVIDAETGVLLGRLANTAWPDSGLYPGFALPDLSHNRVYLLAPIFSSGFTSVRVYDSRDFSLERSFTIWGAIGYITKAAQITPTKLVYLNNGGRLCVVDTSEAVMLGMTLDGSSASAGVNAHGVVQLSNAAPDGGIKVSLKSSDPSTAFVGSSVVVPAGYNSAKFAITPQSTTSPKVVRITASLGQQSFTSDITIEP